MSGATIGGVTTWESSKGFAHSSFFPTRIGAYLTSTGLVVLVGGISYNFQNVLVGLAPNGAHIYWGMDCDGNSHMNCTSAKTAGVLVKLLRDDGPMVRLNMAEQCHFLGKNL